MGLVGEITGGQSDAGIRLCPREESQEAEQKAL